MPVETLLTAPKSPTILIPQKSEYLNGEILIPELAIDQRIKEMGGDIGGMYGGKNLLMTGLLSGAFMFMSDLCKEVWRAGLGDGELDFTSIGSYGKKRSSAGKLIIYKKLKIPVKGRHILLVEDLVDTGFTLAETHQSMLDQGAASVASCVLVSKRINNSLYKPDFVGFSIPDVWIQGRGMDSAELFRMDPNITVGMDYVNLPQELSI